MENLTCRQCGAEFVRAQGEQGRPRVRCFDCLPRRIPAKQPYTSKVCTQCGVDYTGRAMSRYCSDACKWLARKARSGIPCTVCGEPTGYATSAQVANPRCRSCASDWSHGTRAGYRRAKCRCEDCRRWNREAQKAYQADYKRRTGRSLKRKYRPPERRSSDWITQAERFGIYDRDAWVCQLCGEPVDRSLHSNDDMAASLDHITPRSAVVIPDHSPDNLRLAHRVCNTKRYWAEAASA